jgi:UbiD family decarboxylase
VTERGSSPAVLFDSVKGYPKGYLLVNSLGSTKRLGLSLGMPMNLDSMDFVAEWRRRSKALRHIPPVVVRQEPVLENIRRGKDVDLLAFPTPRWFELDGGSISAPAASILLTIPKKVGPTWEPRA